MLNNDSTTRSVEFADNLMLDVSSYQPSSSFQQHSSFQQSSYIHDGSVTQTLPQSKSFTEKDFLSSIISSPSRRRDAVSPTHPEYLSGYTGQLRSMRESYKEDSVTIVPTLGYSGSYKGKIEGKLGKTNVHRSPISRREMNSYDHDPMDEPSHCHSREGNYHNCKLESKSRGQTFDSIMKGIEARIHFRYPRLYAKITSLKNLFEKYDGRRTGTISFEDFQVCCVYLNIVLPREEFTTLAANFDEEACGAIQYRKFINYMCKAYTDDEILAAEI